jgi:hypothetical protein
MPATVQFCLTASSKSRSTKRHRAQGHARTYVQECDEVAGGA